MDGFGTRRAARLDSMEVRTLLLLLLLLLFFIRAYVLHAFVRMYWCFGLIVNLLARLVCDARLPRLLTVQWR